MNHPTRCSPPSNCFCTNRNCKQQMHLCTDAYLPWWNAYTCFDDGSSPVFVMYAHVSPQPIPTSVTTDFLVVAPYCFECKVFSVVQLSIQSHNKLVGKIGTNHLFDFEVQSAYRFYWPCKMQGLFGIMQSNRSCSGWNERLKLWSSQLSQSSTFSGTHHHSTVLTIVQGSDQIHIVASEFGVLGITSVINTADIWNFISSWQCLG
jgi:hypothetical protein